MRQLFSGFYSPNDEDIKSSWSNENTLFVFDTNVLLNLYGYTEVTRKDFFKVLEKISNIWIPYHVGLEYQRNRLNVVKKEKEIFNLLEKYIKNIESKVDNSEFTNLRLSQRLPKLFEESEKLHLEINKLFSKYRESIQEWNDKQPDVRSSDKIRKKIDTLFKDKVGNSFSEQKELDEIYKEGKERYKNNIPPGYKDEKEKKNTPNFTYGGLSYSPMYGDLIIWKQILEKAKEENINTVIFITDDAKEDWWYILDSNGKKEIGVRAELREEIHRESDISSFEVLRTTDFMQNGKEFLDLEVKDESIAETKNSIERQSQKNYENTLLKEKYKLQVEEIMKQFTEKSGIERDIINFNLNNESLNIDLARYQDAFELSKGFDFKNDWKREEARRSEILEKNILKSLKYSKPKISLSCPCGSGLAYGKCCGQWGKLNI